MDKYLVIKKIFEAREDKENALSMAKYMINMSDFYGLPTPKRKSEDISKIQNKII
ncbi:MAG: DNA alkylation repair protein [Erysipelotrichia bacterium]|nr:DNA alkylation repair protein [Erysipelotrichia bacterium]